MSRLPAIFPIARPLTATAVSAGEKSGNGKKIIEADETEIIGNAEGPGARRH